MPAAVAALEPSTLGCWSKCFTTVLPQLFSPLLCSSDSCSIRTWTLNFEMMSWIFYHCATINGQVLGELFALFFLPMPAAVVGLEPLSMRWLGEWATIPSNVFETISPFSLTVLAVGAGLEPQTLHWRDHCATAAAADKVSHNASFSSWTLTLNIGMLQRVFYNCATADSSFFDNSFPLYFIQVPAAALGLEPSTLRWWGEYSTPVLPLIAMHWENFY